MRSDMKKCTAVDGAQFTDADLERWAEEEIGRAHV